MQMSDKLLIPLDQSFLTSWSHADILNPPARFNQNVISIER
jgi:hypothetical protein